MIINYYTCITARRTAYVPWHAECLRRASRASVIRCLAVSQACFAALHRHHRHHTVTPQFVSLRFFKSNIDLKIEVFCGYNFKSKYV